jgi:ubiquitin-protein ligase
MDSKTPLPRSIKLFYELSADNSFGHVSYGVIKDDNLYPNNRIELIHWTGSIITKNFDIVNVYIKCDETYPTQKPYVKFDQDAMKSNSIKRVCDINGVFSSNVQWTSESCIGNYLLEIKNLIDI